MITTTIPLLSITFYYPRLCLSISTSVRAGIGTVVGSEIFNHMVRRCSFTSFRSTSMPLHRLPITHYPTTHRLTTTTPLPRSIPPPRSTIPKFSTPNHHRCACSPFQAIVAGSVLASKTGSLMLDWKTVTRECSFYLLSLLLLLYALHDTRHMDDDPGGKLRAAPRSTPTD